MSDSSIHGTVGDPVRRIISLAPSVTEMLFYLGMGESVIGVTNQCDFPAEVSGIDSVGSFSLPDTERILELSPDVMIGVSGLHRHIPEAFRDEGTGVILLDYHDVQGILDTMEAISNLAIDAEKARERVDLLRHRTDVLRACAGNTVRTLFLRRESLLMIPSRNSYQYDALQIAGASQMAIGFSEYERVSMEEVLHFDPEVILACGHRRAETPQKMCPDCQSAQPLCQRLVDDIGLMSGWKETSASLSGNIIALPCHWLCRPGPRLIDGMESVARILQRSKRI
jgi:iron complex transport system substrate-binding protein